jgi:hypothetical protein
VGASDGWHRTCTVLVSGGRWTAPAPGLQDQRREVATLTAGEKLDLTQDIMNLPRPAPAGATPSSA